MRCFIVALAVVASSLSSGAFAQTCVDSDPETCSIDGLISFCQNGTPQTLSCDQFASGSTCASVNCIGSGCPDTVRCESERGGACLGIATLFDGDTANDDQLGLAACESGSVCAVVGNAETCTAPPAGAPSSCSVADSGLKCRGSLIVGCIGFATTNVLATPNVIDCDDGNGSTCVEGDGTIGCANPACGTDGEGRCDGGTAVDCDAGVIVNQTDCLSLGQACLQDSPTSSPFCSTTDPACGPNGLGSCSGVTATICDGGAVTTTTDCSAVDRVCGAINATGRIGCVAPGEGEGEGEGEPSEGEGEGEAECEDDGDCDRGQSCEDGVCERSRAGGEPIAPPPSLFSCAQGGVFPLLPVLAVVAWKRRRR